MHRSLRCRTRVVLVRPVLLFAILLIFAAKLASSSFGASLQPQLLVEEGQQAFEKGDFSQAAVQWDQAVNVYQKQGNTNAAIQTSISLAAALQSAGQQRRAIEILTDALARAEETHDRSRITFVKSKLGAALVLTPDAERGRLLLQEALEAARADGDAPLSATTLNDLGNALASQQQYAEALKDYEESAALAQQTSNSLLRAQAECNAAEASVQAGEINRAEQLNTTALGDIEHLPAAHDKAFLLLTAARTDLRIQSTNAEFSPRVTLRAQQSFEKAEAIAGTNDDLAVETYAFGYLGQMYEHDGQPDVALKLTHRAEFAAQEAQMPEALYRWEWQSARLVRRQGDFDASIAAYRRALQTLQSIRSDFSSGYGNASTRLTFRESEGPLFYELADLLLQQAKATTDSAKEQELLLEARDTVENLKSVELQDYFCDECVDIERMKTRAVEAVDKHSAVIYLIPLSDRTELLVGLNSGLKRFTVPVGADDLTAQVREFRRNLETRTSYAYLAQAQQLYDWLIRPIRGLLNENQINTLVFVPDGALRTVPFAALHDGDKFLIQDLAVAVVPGLSLVEPKAIERGNVRLLLNGVSKPVQGFAPLDFVTNELDSIRQTYAGETLLDEKFTTE